MTAPSFRRTQNPHRSGDPGPAEGPLLQGPFTQAQIQHILKAEFARSRRYGFPLAALVLLVDRLSRLVDLHGAELRATVRAGLARVLSRRVRTSDHLGSLPGDRLLLLLPHTDVAGAEAVARRLREEFARLDFKLAGARLPLTLSAGIAGDGGGGLFHDALLGRAEAALEEATAAGGDRIVTFGTEGPG